MKGCSGKILNLVKLPQQTVPGGPVYSAASSPASPPHTAQVKPEADTAPSQDACADPSAYDALSFPFLSAQGAFPDHPGWVWHWGFLHQDVGLTDLYVC